MAKRRRLNFELVLVLKELKIARKNFKDNTYVPQGNYSIKTETI